MAANSRQIVAKMRASGVAHYGNVQRNLPSMTINTASYSPPIYVARNSDPVVIFTWDNCQGKKANGGEKLIRDHLTGIRIPPGALPAKGTDREMVIYNADTKQYTDLWVTTKITDRKWKACWGGTIPDASKSGGVFAAPFGTSAAGLALEGGTIKASELAAGEINHVIGIALPPDVLNGRISAPAVRTDGRDGAAHNISQGQLMRLPASLDIDAMNLNPTTRAVAKGAQKYGFIVWDRSGAITFRAENPVGMSSNPYPELFGGMSNWNVLWGNPAKGEQAFPFDRLQVLESDYIPPATPSTPSVGDSTPTQPSRTLRKWSAAGIFRP